MEESPKRGRPKIEDPRIYSYRLRLNAKEWKELQTLIKNGINVSEILRLAITTKVKE